MANTKLVYFEGTTVRGTRIDADDILRATSGSYCVVREHFGDYLDTTDDTVSFWIGALHTSSMRSPADVIGGLFTRDATVVVTDLDWTDSCVYEYEAGALVNEIRYRLATGHQRPGTRGAPSS